MSLLNHQVFQNQMRFRSKVDLWLATLIIVVSAMAIDAAWLVLRQPYGTIQALLLISIGTLMPVWILFSTQYEIIDENLWVRSGPLKWRIPILSISKIERSKSWVSSPALSMSRFKIDYGRGKSILISPKETDRFLYAIRHAIAHGSLVREGDGDQTVSA